MKVVKKKTIRKKLIKAIICTVITAGDIGEVKPHGEQPLLPM